MDFKKNIFGLAATSFGWMASKLIFLRLSLSSSSGN